MSRSVMAILADYDIVMLDVALDDFLRGIDSHVDMLLDESQPYRSARAETPTEPSLSHASPFLRVVFNDGATALELEPYAGVRISPSGNPLSIKCFGEAKETCIQLHVGPTDNTLTRMCSALPIGDGLFLYHSSDHRGAAAPRVHKISRNNSEIHIELSVTNRSIRHLFPFTLIFPGC